MEAGGRAPALGSWAETRGARSRSAPARYASVTLTATLLKTLTLLLCAATHLDILEPPSSARFPDPLTLPGVCTPNIFSGWPSERLTSPLAPQILSRRPSAFESWPSDVCGQLLEMLVVQPVTFDDLAYSVFPFLLNAFALSEFSPLPTMQYEYCPNIPSKNPVSMPSFYSLLKFFFCSFH